MSKFTSGRWSIRGREIGIVDQSESQSCGMMDVICRVDEYDFANECLANAHLISAAPDMYTALRGLLEAHHHVYGLDGAWGSEVKAAEAALAKADGEV